MRIEIDDSNSYRHEIDTNDPILAGKWFAEKAQLLMSANYAYGQCKLRIWPSTYEETTLIGHHEIKFTSDALLELGNHILNASKQMSINERKRNAHK